MKAAEFVATMAHSLGNDGTKFPLETPSRLLRRDFAMLASRLAGIAAAYATDALEIAPYGIEKPDLEKPMGITAVELFAKDIGDHLERILRCARDAG